MLCPFCGFENIDGADACDGCNASLTGAGVASASRTSLEEKIARGPIALLQPSEAVTVEADHSVGEVIALMARRNFGCAVVVRDGELVGVFTERDALMKIGASIGEAGRRPVAEFMTPTPETLLSTDTIAFALNRMAVGDYRHIPIEQRRRPLAIISVRDVLGYVTRNFPEVLADAS